MAKQEMYRTCPKCGQLLQISVVRCDCGHADPLDKWHVAIAAVATGIVSYLFFCFLAFSFDLILLLIERFPFIYNLLSGVISHLSAGFLYCFFVFYFCRIFYSSEAAVSLYASFWVGILGIVSQLILCVLNFLSDYSSAALINALLVLCNIAILLISRHNISVLKETGIAYKSDDYEIAALVQSRRNDAVKKKEYIAYAQPRIDAAYNELFLGQRDPFSGAIINSEEAYLRYLYAKGRRNGLHKQYGTCDDYIRAVKEKRAASLNLSVLSEESFAQFCVDQVFADIFHGQINPYSKKPILSESDYYQYLEQKKAAAAACQTQSTLTEEENVAE